MQLSAQSIIVFCNPPKVDPRGVIISPPIKPMISPFSPEKVVVNGRSKGLGPATYDITIDSDLTLGVNPALIIQQAILEGWSENNGKALLRNALRANPPMGAIARSTEKLAMPHFVSAEVMDKSTHARLLVGMFNTYIDPGFEGDLVLELVNHGAEPLVLKAGDPIAQLKFTLLDQPTDRPYSGKYQGQVGVQGAILEDVSTAAPSSILRGH